MFVPIIVVEYMRFIQQLKFHMYPQQTLIAMHVSSNIENKQKMSFVGKLEVPKMQIDH